MQWSFTFHLLMTCTAWVYSSNGVHTEDTCPAMIKNELQSKYYAHNQAYDGYCRHWPVINGQYHTGWRLRKIAATKNKSEKQSVNHFMKRIESNV